MPHELYDFQRLFTMQCRLRNWLRAAESEIAALRTSLEIAAHTGKEKYAGYATFLLGRAY